MAIRTNSHAAEICSVPGITKMEMSRGHVMTERRRRSARLAATHVVDFERVRRLTCYFLGGTPLTSTPTLDCSRTIMLH
jgi:hypothetical protein